MKSMSFQTAFRIRELRHIFNILHVYVTNGIGFEHRSFVAVAFAAGAVVLPGSTASKLACVKGQVGMHLLGSEVYSEVF